MSIRSGCSSHVELWFKVGLLLIAVTCASSNPAFRQTSHLRRHKGLEAVQHISRSAAVAQRRYTKAHSIPSSGSTAVEPANGGKHQPGSNQDRYSDDTSPSEDFNRCYSQLLQVSADGSSVSQAEYLRYLTLNSQGQLQYTIFSQLPPVYMLLYYVAACGEGQDCSSSSPAISLDLSTRLSSSPLKDFCNEIRSYTYTSAVVGFDYTIQFDPSRISNDELQLCLITATESLLQDHLGCLDQIPRELADDVSATGQRSVTSPSVHRSPLAGPHRRVASCQYASDHRIDGIIPLRKSKIMLGIDTLSLVAAAELLCLLRASYSLLARAYS
jgi:hypothetical protein